MGNSAYHEVEYPLHSTGSDADQQLDHVWHRRFPRDKHLLDNLRIRPDCSRMRPPIDMLQSVLHDNHLQFRNLHSTVPDHSARSTDLDHIALDQCSTAPKRVSYSHRRSRTEVPIATEIGATKNWFVPVAQRERTRHRTEAAADDSYFVQVNPICLKDGG